MGAAPRPRCPHPAGAPRWQHGEQITPDPISSPIGSPQNIIPPAAPGTPSPIIPLPGDPACPQGAKKKARPPAGRTSPWFLGSARRYLSTVTLPLLTGRKRTGSDTLMGLNWNLQPKQSAESLKKETETMGLSKIWMGSTWETMQPPGW